MPHYDHLSFDAAAGYWKACTGANCDIIHAHGKYSILPDNFNAMYIQALNGRVSHGITHFAIIHADVGPENGWLDTLLLEMWEHDADLIGTVIPIKDLRGNTSTALGLKDDHWHKKRRITMRECANLPATFTREDTGLGDEYELLINTGLMVVDVTKKWAHECWFQFQNKIVWEDNKWMNKCIPEDWDFSHQWNQKGGKTVATRKVAVRHKGSQDYGNEMSFGAWRYDENYGDVAPLPVGSGRVAAVGGRATPQPVSAG